MSRRWRIFAALGVVVPVLLCAAPAERDLGQGLRYVRIRELPADLPASPSGPRSGCVVDVRYVPAGRDAAVAFMAWLKFRATPRAPVFVLANRETSAELRRVLAEPHRGTGVVVLGIAGPGFDPDVLVPSTPENDKAAYDALEKSVPLEALLTDLPGKVRHDEARLARGLPPAAEGDGPTAKPRPGPVDATLQRAVHLHRALAVVSRNNRRP
jgi:hypothetical protein